MHTLHHRDHRHLGWDHALPPALELAPGEVVELAMQDAFGGQLTAGSTASDVPRLDLAAANPLTGPIDVLGAQPGDTLALTIEHIDVGPVGWTAIIPGFGLLADEFPDPHLVVSAIDGDEVVLGDLARLERRPFLGTVGLAPAEAGPHSVIPPRRVGGNLDCRDVRAGTTLLLPVEVAGARLSAGDPHAAQGDGEVCGTAVETTATARLRVELRRDQPVPAPQLELPADRTAPAPAGPHRRVTMGVGPDLLTGARDATRAMIELLGRHGLAPEDAYVLCSVAGDLRIIEVVDAPNWVVGLELDLAVLG
ncbi:MAG: acetamidase/formamidase family protein [Nitriliruptoraceae bacterium]